MWVLGSGSVNPHSNSYRVAIPSLTSKTAPRRTLSKQGTSRTIAVGSAVNHYRLVLFGRLLRLNAQHFIGSPARFDSVIEHHQSLENPEFQYRPLGKGRAGTAVIHSVVSTAEALVRGHVVLIPGNCFDSGHSYEHDSLQIQFCRIQDPAKIGAEICFESLRGS